VVISEHLDVIGRARCNALNCGHNKITKCDRPQEYGVFGGGGRGGGETGVTTSSPTALSCTITITFPCGRRILSCENFFFPNAVRLSHLPHSYVCVLYSELYVLLGALPAMARAPQSLTRFILKTSLVSSRRPGSTAGGFMGFRYVDFSLGCFYDTCRSKAEQGGIVHAVQSV
jgi:hypothetical protein